MGWPHVHGAPSLGVALSIESQIQNPIHERSALGFRETGVVHDGLGQWVLACDVVLVAGMEFLDEPAMGQSVRLG